MECILLDLCFTSKSLSIYLQYWESLLGISLTINLALLCIALHIAFIAFTASDDVFQISISSISVSEDSYLEWWNRTWYKGKCREDLTLYRIGILYLIKVQLCMAVVELSWYSFSIYGSAEIYNAGLSDEAASCAIVRRTHWHWHWLISRQLRLDDLRMGFCNRSNFEYTLILGWSLFIRQLYYRVTIQYTCAWCILNNEVNEGQDFSCRLERPFSRVAFKIHI